RAASSLWGGLRTRLLDDGSAGPVPRREPLLTRSDDVEEPSHADSSLPGDPWADQTHPGFRDTTRSWINDTSNAPPGLIFFSPATTGWAAIPRGGLFVVPFLPLHQGAVPFQWEADRRAVRGAAGSCRRVPGGDHQAGARVR